MKIEAFINAHKENEICTIIINFIILMIMV